MSEAGAGADTSGGDLATQLEIHGAIGATRTRFYAADLVEGLEHL
jgi:protein-serine/threonine kinase